MQRFEEDDQEPVAVVRTLSDFALALTLVVLMLIGTHSAAENTRGTETRAATAQAGTAPPELTLVLQENGMFTSPSQSGEKTGVDAAAVAKPWMAAHPQTPATIVLQFPQKTLATDLHHALLGLQTAFGTNLAHINTLPQL